jgi:hypothetical protein
MRRTVKGKKLKVEGSKAFFNLAPLTFNLQSFIQIWEVQP